MHKHSLHKGPSSIPERQSTPHDFGGTAAGYFHEAHGVIAGRVKSIEVAAKLAQAPAKAESLIERAKLEIAARLGVGR